MNTTTRRAICTVPLIHVAVTESLSTATAPALEATLREILPLRPRLVVVDLAACELIDAAAIEVLLDLHRALWRQDGRLTLRSVSPRLNRLLTLARAAQVLDISTHEGDVTLSS
ncbi:STAS domain-containing protein [Asanoa hainanensis]|uniref:STAS domain-containing protein n=1 Tax=Asanoa hainanensis TaxID=560556 RepID=UPI0015C61DAA|nr:STAS domain-containing protein [Asanoa hainanensis]